MRDRVLEHISVTDTNDVMLRFRGNSNFVHAKALESATDETGKLSYVLLDRMVHAKGESRFDHHSGGTYRTILVKGCYVSEFRWA
jgi:hypothetical protein